MACNTAEILLLFVIACSTALGHSDVHPKTLFPVKSVRVLLSSSATLTPNCTSLTRNGQPVEVRVTSIAAPHKNDMVALYAPPEVDPRYTVPLSWVTISDSSPDYVRTGSGTVTFALLNLRADVVFRLLRNGTNLPGAQDIVVEGQSPIIKTAIASQPTQGHLALDFAGRYVVQWISGSHDQQLVQWGLSPKALVNAAISSAVTYHVSQMCGTPANGTGWLDPGWLHHAVIPSIPGPGSRVWYRFGSDAAGWSKAFSFAAPPAPGKGTKFLVFNDVGMSHPVLFNTPPSLCPPYCPAGFNWAETYSSNSSKLLKYISKEDADVALLLGDLSYAQGYAVDWDIFGMQFEPAFTRWPLMVGTGNHERDWPGTGDVFEESLDSGGECNVPLTYRYYTPASYPRLDRQVSFYSFNMGNIHFVVLDSETPSQRGSSQHSFVEADLAAVDRSMTPWIIVGMHRMMSAPSKDVRPVVGDQDNMRRLQDNYEDLFIKQRVALVLTGHQHAYARTCPMYRGKCVDASQHGIVHVMAGHAGAGFTHNFPSKDDGSFDFEDWVMYGVQDQNGYVRVTTDRDTMLVETISTDDGKVFDSAMIKLFSDKQQPRWWSDALGTPLSKLIKRSVHSW